MPGKTTKTPKKTKTPKTTAAGTAEIAWNVGADNRIVRPKMHAGQLDRIEKVLETMCNKMVELEKKLDELLSRPYIMQGWDYERQHQTPGWDRNTPPPPMPPMRYWGPPMEWFDRPKVWGEGPTCNGRDDVQYRLNDTPYGDYDPRRNPHCEPRNPCTTSRCHV